MLLFPWWTQTEPGWRCKVRGDGKEVSTWDEDMWWHYPLVCGIIMCCQQRTQVLNGCSCWWMGTQQSNWWMKKGKRASLSWRERTWNIMNKLYTRDGFHPLLACQGSRNGSMPWGHQIGSGVAPFLFRYFFFFLPAKGRAFFICPCLSVNSIGHLNSYIYIYILPIYINTCPALISQEPKCIRKAIFLPPRSKLLMSGEGRYAWHHYTSHHKIDDVGGRVIKRNSRRVSFTFHNVCPSLLIHGTLDRQTIYE